MCAQISKVQWHDIFTTGKIHEGMTDKEVVAAGIGAWACCTVGNRPPEKFGEGMVAIHQRLDIQPSYDGLKSYAVKQGWLP